METLDEKVIMIMNVCPQAEPEVVYAMLAEAQGNVEAVLSFLVDSAPAAPPPPPPKLEPIDETVLELAQRATVPEKPSNGKKYTLDDFNYKFNKDGKMVNAISNDDFFFINQIHYEALGDAVTDHIMDEVLEKQMGMKRIELRPECPIFKSKNADDCATLLVIVQGCGQIRPGQWSRKQVMNNGFAAGGHMPYITAAQELGFGVIVLNPNQNKVDTANRQEYRFKKDFLVQGLRKIDAPNQPNMELIKGCETGRDHVLTAWDEVISKTAAQSIVFAAHSAGGDATVNLIRARLAEVKLRCKAFAFLDSLHEVPRGATQEMTEFFKKTSCAWMGNNAPLGTPLGFDHPDCCMSISPGSTDHDAIPNIVRELVFQFFMEKL
eukprot:TRINITY_DN64861_c0_g2_i1.p1 TRINITY_DN64861_c0_g2~~TRINITY_DN64861_c0_g2_i1.p1  ORF type:complete len:379 (-),score=36.25 TRINITY_DN64861_c0_g2_i1:1166-2302(-)